MNEKIERKAEVKRETKETKIIISVNIDGTGKSNLNSGIGFFDHMLEQIAKHANIDLDVKVDGDLHVDEHHTVEDVGIALGEALLKALPMDESIALCVIDLGGRFHLNFKAKFKRNKVGEFPTELTEEFFRGLASGLKANLYMKVKGKNDHHKIEAIFKSFAKALNEACRLDERNNGRIPSTKGII